MGSFAEPHIPPRVPIQLTNHLPRLGPNVRITPQARYYAVAELCRRAGITREFFRSWKVSVTPQKTVFEITNGTQKYITFPHATAQVLTTLAAGELRSANVHLAQGIGGAQGLGIDHCVVPFVAPEFPQDRPLFYLTDQNHRQCALDL